jgi:hypothetical protein
MVKELVAERMANDDCWLQLLLSSSLLVIYLLLLATRARELLLQAVLSTQYS